MPFEIVKQKGSRWIDACASAGNCVTMLFMVMIITLISVEIFIRTVFKFSTFISEKPLIYFLIAVVMAGAAQLLKNDGRSRRKARFSHGVVKVQRTFSLTIILAAFVLCSFAFYQSLIMLRHTYSMNPGVNHISGASLFIPQAVIPVGFLLFDLQLIGIFFSKVALPKRIRYRQKQ
ncbi:MULTISPECIES: TRAP transporter small permease subunit [Desulfococcus]|uniref:Tripartite ATP-independent periplasmic transporter DctQ component n=1 Tax=Desulfococcus multivorans DSM 2059 TaxID=1121405 RepID=S7UP16_DESML|nr:TRAP transporter small permease subunit [Desulfococcus multivorans]AOY58896.1 TRAP-type C4-dicarboxylate transport system, dctQ-like [Desulfococcus multivorans]EPR34068.1 Tripartite ATP-independent periplasmic transporter DctQ component [Desulfococcus multivorans DSM 2059]SJZ52785.1 TRAP-type mannitol/chloroaromatic compound transport system, small permease component [Desulfococcus multivorans DSM 2059]